MADIEYRPPGHRPRVSPLFWIGLILLIVGSGPLLGIIAAAHFGWTKDPNPNPVGLGIMAACSFWPAIGMIIAGIIITVVRRRRSRTLQAIHSSRGLGETDV